MVVEIRPPVKWDKGQALLWIERKLKSDKGLRYLLARKYDIYALQILSPEEIDPVLAGDLRLTDIEDEDFAEVTVGRALLNRYKRNLEAYCSGLRDFCTARGISYMFTSTEVPFDQMVLSYFRKRGLLK